MDRTLDALLGDMPETEVAKSSVEATVTKKKDNNRFIIRDATMEAELEVDDKFRNKIEVGYKFAFYSPEKSSSEKLKLSKTSHAKKLYLDTDVDDSAPENALRMKDLIGKKHQSTVEECLIVKVFDKYEPQVTKTGKHMR